MPIPSASPRFGQPAPARGGPAYRAHSGRDELLADDAAPRDHWHALLPSFAGDGLPALAERQEAANRMLADQGATFNVYSDVGAARPWQLDVIPLVITTEEWKKIQAGIEQRATVLAAFLADVYGPGHLLRDGVIPPALVHSNPAFLPMPRGVLPPGGRFLITCGCDLLRGGDGQWRVLRDQTQSPAGLGQVLENRMVTAGLFPSEFADSRIERLGAFYELERHAFRSLAPPRRDGPSVVVLSPGFTHPAYFEHAYKARALGFPLVEGADLTVRERRVYLKTLDGLRQVDVIIRRIPDADADPLETWTTSLAGVPGLAEAWRSGNVALANGIGSALAESPAILPFLPRLCRAILGEDLKLPFVESWWLGQKAVLEEILRHLPRYLILPAAPGSPIAPIRAGKLDAAARRELADVLRARPHEWVAQREIMASTTPAMDGRRLVARPFVWRTFSLVGGNQNIALRGGLARLGDPNQPPGLWSMQGGLSKDVWVVASDDTSAAAPHGPFPTAVVSAIGATGHRPASEVPSRIGEQLFWLGRYAERLEHTTRMLRAALRRLTGEGIHASDADFSACLALLRGEGLMPTLPAPGQPGVREALVSRVTNPDVEDSIPWLLQRLRFNAAGARDRLSDDTWKLFARFDDGRPAAGTLSLGLLLQSLDSLILHLAAFAGMQAENMTRGHGWRFLEIGRRAERCHLVAALLASAEAAGKDNRPLLDALLEIGDSTMTYRRRHFSAPRWLPVIDLLANDATNPRSLASQLQVLAGQSDHLPGDPAKGLLPDLRAHVQTLCAAVPVSGESVAALAYALRDGIEGFSDWLTQNYFSHAIRRVF